MKIITDPRCTEYSARGHPERPERISRAVELLRAQDKLKLTWGEPAPVLDEFILRAHTAQHLSDVQGANGFRRRYSRLILNTSPITPTPLRRRGLQALACAEAGETSFSLMRPPGHHATRQRPMGFCYFNSIAVAVLAARVGGRKRVAVFDFDVHHGNGTEDILLDQPGSAFISIHQFPAYPGTRLGKPRAQFVFNFPVPPATPRLEKVSIAPSCPRQLRRIEKKTPARHGGRLGRGSTPTATTRYPMKRWKRRISTGSAKPFAAWASRPSAFWKAATARFCPTSFLLI